MKPEKYKKKNIQFPDELYHMKEMIDVFTSKGKTRWLFINQIRMKFIVNVNYCNKKKR
jgi:hypothetical protein